MGNFGETVPVFGLLGGLLVASAALALLQRLRIMGLQALVAEQGMALDNANQRLAQVKGQLGMLSNKDPVTHLLARHVVVERFQLLRTQARRYGTKFGIVLISLTEFERVLAESGKGAADRLLADVASRLVAMTREADTVGFMRGHDFAVLMPHVESEAALDAVVAKVRSALQVPFTLLGVAHPLVPEVHFGRALYPDDGEDWMSVMRTADNHLLVARERGATAGRGDETPPQGDATGGRAEPSGWGDTLEVPARLWEPLATLGLGWPVTLEAARTRYKALAKRDHPDANGGSLDAEERQKTLNVAYAEIRSVLEPKGPER